MMAKKAPNPIDKHVGSRVRMRRMMLGMSQEKLGAALGLTFQQVQKYEKGTNRVSAGRLQRIADMLNIPVTFFYGGVGARAKKREANDPALAFMQTRGAVRLMRAYSEISSRSTKYALVVLAESLSNKKRG